jgi:perosamine synthetase
MAEYKISNLGQNLMKEIFSKTADFIRELYREKKHLPLHEPVFIGREKDLVNECLDSTFVSSVGPFVVDFEKMVAAATGMKHAVAITNGTTALHLALILTGVRPQDEVLCPTLTFVATANSIRHACAEPIFIDSCRDQLGMCPESLEEFLSRNTFLDTKGQCINKITRNVIRACIPMHALGHPAKTQEITLVCERYGILVVEDAAEALGSKMNGRHVGHHGRAAILSFNGNKIVTTGGGGMILTDDGALASRAKHVSTTAKKSHPYLFDHDEVGYNYRLPNLNAALGRAQIEMLPKILENKRKTAQCYKRFFDEHGIRFIDEPKGAESNFWLSGILLDGPSERDEFLHFMNSVGIMCRPLWTPMHQLQIYRNSQKTHLPNAERFAETVVNLPSGYRKT